MKMNGGGAALDWDITTKEAYAGVYSIRSPDLSNNYKQEGAFATLTTEEGWGSSTLTYALLSTARLPADGLVVLVDGVGVEAFVEPTVGWEVFELRLGAGAHEVQWVYAYNPTQMAGDVPDAGVVFLDEVRVTARRPTYAPVSSWPTGDPTFFPTTQYPTGYPTAEA